MTSCPHAYVDTSVYGGVFDEEFTDASKDFFDLVMTGRIQLFTSEVVSDEIALAPGKVRDYFDMLLPKATIVKVTAETLSLQQAYILAGILTEKWYDDALHVAVATVAGCDLIVSWNFKHIVNFNKIPKFNAVNILQGYRHIDIYSPFEVTDNEE
jgi:predicted nucleic acid-binding protein